MQPQYYGAAAQYHRPPASPIGNILKIAGIIIGVIVLLTVGYILYNSLTSTGQNNAAKLVARQKQLTSFIGSAKISNDSLSALNSNALSLTTSDLYALQQGLKSAYGITEISDSITSSEADTTSAQKLDTAKQQNQYDKIYAQILAQKLNSAKTLAEQVKSNSSGSLKSATQTAISHYNTILDALGKLNL